MLAWWAIVCLVLIALVSLVTTIVFCFWSVYLFDAIRQKRKSYQKTILRIKEGYGDEQQHILAYNAKTEYVKNLFLLIQNFIEWIAFTSAKLGYVLYLMKEYDHYEGQAHNASEYTNYGVLFIQQDEMQPNYSFAYSFLFLPDTFNIMSLIVIASLCMYLASRQARTSWIKSTRIPYLIGFFLICCVIIEILASFCSSHIIADWLSAILITVSLIIAFKQYKMLKMVINWSIVDLDVSQRKKLMEKQLKLKKHFTRIFTCIFAGYLSLLICSYLMTIFHTLVISFRENDSSYRLSLCHKPEFSNSTFTIILSIIFYTKFVFELIGISCIFIPYIGYGLSTMYVVLWRLLKGRTGYRTHFHNELSKRLI